VYRAAWLGGLVTAATWGSSKELKVPPRLEMGECLGGLAAASGKLQTATALARDPRIAKERRELFARPGYRAVLAIPLTIEGRPLGVLEAFSRRPAGFTDEEVATATAY